MTDNLHEDAHKRAQEFFAQSLVEGLSGAERVWLDQHLRDCSDCAREIRATHELSARCAPCPSPYPAISRLVPNCESVCARKKPRPVRRAAALSSG